VGRAEAIEGLPGRASVAWQHDGEKICRASHRLSRRARPPPGPSRGDAAGLLRLSSKSAVYLGRLHLVCGDAMQPANAATATVPEPVMHRLCENALTLTVRGRGPAGQTQGRRPQRQQPVPHPVGSTPVPPSAAVRAPRPTAPSGVPFPSYETSADVSRMHAVMHSRMSMHTIQAVSTVPAVARSRRSIALLPLFEHRELPVRNCRCGTAVRPR
jgi:hypothetical protein